MRGRYRRPLTALAALLVAGRAEATTLDYPGAGACGASLQACIDSANAGDTVEIGTNAPIDTDLTIAKSLTLAARSGFSPVIGTTATHHTLTVADAGVAGGAVDVTVTDLTLNNAEVAVTLDDDSGHTVTIRRLKISHGSGALGGRGIAVDVAAPASTIVLGENVVTTPGDVLRLATALSAGSATLTAIGNRITTFNPTGSHTGIVVDLSGAGTVTTYLYSNVIYGVSRGAGGAGIDVFSSGAVTAAVNIVNNTLDDIQGTSNGIQVRAPTGSAEVTVNIFNNLVTRGSKSGIAILSPGVAELTVNQAFNDFFANSAPEDYGGYGPAGPMTLNVDPQYVSATTANYRLITGSPLVDAATSNPPGGLPSTDADSGPRVVGAAPDIGAYELGSVPTTTTTTVAPTTTTSITLPPVCGPGGTLDSVACRLDELAAAAGIAVAPGRTLIRLESAAGRARDRVHAADDFLEQDRKRPARTAITRALRALQQFQARLRSRRGQKDVADEVRTQLLGAADAIRADLRALRQGVR